jgi:hypothetical protein
LKLFEVLGGKPAVALAVLVGAQGIEFVFPKAHQRFRDLEHLGHLTDGIISFFEWCIRHEAGYW